MRAIATKVCAFWQDRSGAVSLAAAAIVPILAIGAAMGVELAEVARAKVRMQGYVDSAAMSGAVQFGTDQSTATAERARVSADVQAASLKARWTIETGASLDAKLGSVTVTQDAHRPSFFGSLLPPGGFHLAVTATATANSRVPLCVLGLERKGKPVSADANSVMTAPGCLVQSNNDLGVKDTASLSAAAVRAVGAATGPIRPEPLSDAPAVPDPFASLDIEVPEGKCVNQDIILSVGSLTVNPGVHCGKVQLTGSARLVLNPGEHYFFAGEFNVQDSAQIIGTDVVLIFKGAYKMDFKDDSSMSLEGRESGPYAGFVLVTDRSFTGTLTIAANRARTLLGTIYLPNATFVVNGTANTVADQSPWTVVVAKRMQMQGSANLVINSDYAASTVPVPTGVGPVNGGVRLTE